MQEKIEKQSEARKKALFHHKGVTYFDKKTERNVFFFLTMAMLLWGVFAKLGLL